MKLIIIISLIFFSGHCCAQSQAQFDSLFEAYGKNGFSGCVSVWKNDKAIFTRSYGYSNEKEKTLNSKNTLFNIASLSKLVTAALVIKLQEEGALNVSDKISNYIGLANNRKDSATIFHLLSHTAGLVRRGAELGYSTSERLIATTKSSPMESPPGEQHRYSNIGYTLLALICERASGQPFEQLIRQYMWHPAGLTKAQFAWEPVNNEQSAIATGYDQSGLPIARDTSRLEMGASGILISVAEWQQWFNHLVHGDIISQQGLDILFYDYLPGKETFALHKELNNNQKKYYWKGGGLSNFESQFVYFPDSGATGVFFINFNKGLRKEIFPPFTKVLETIKR